MDVHATQLWNRTMSTKPRHHRIDAEQLGSTINLRAPHHDDRNSEISRGLDLCVGRRSAAVLADNDVDAFVAHELLFGRPGERPACKNKSMPRQRHDVSWPIDRAHDVAMLWRPREGRQLQPAVGKQDTSRTISKSPNCRIDVINHNPPIAGLLLPSRPGEGNERNVRTLASAPRMLRDAHCERMGRVDHRIDVLRHEIGEKSIGPAKTANSGRDRRQHGVFSATGERQYRFDGGILAETLRQHAGFSGASKDKNAHLFFPRIAGR
jgi:hypothetical protein